MKQIGKSRKAFVEKMGTVTINMEEYEHAGADTDVLKMVIDKIEDLPPLPLIVHKILNVTQDENSDTGELAKVISNDQALTAKVLRIVNSPLYHVSTLVTSISHAVTLLGFRAIRNLSMGLSTIETFGQLEENPFLPRQRFWEHSLACAHCCKAIADRIRHRFPDEAFVGGLLHDIGRMVFDQFFPGSFTVALQEAYASRKPLLELETEEIGISHTLVGKLLLQKWNLPPSLADAVANHHNPSLKEGADPSRADVSLIIMVADILTKIACIGSGGDSYVHIPGHEIWKSIGLEEGDYLPILFNLSEQVEEIKGFFGIKEVSSSSQPSPRIGEEGKPPRLAFYWENNGESPVPVRLMLQRFFTVKSFPIDDDIRGSIEGFSPHILFVDLSFEKSTQGISEAVKAYRSATKGPVVFLLSKKISQETRERSAKIGIYFLSTPFSPQEVSDCLCQVDLNNQ
ncbi:MAG: HDOD domain-containing protein [Deltaproteobacteria bacterium]|nr:HDOD domain-containing protein [Deltaproteobacteria bacterium]